MYTLYYFNVSCDTQECINSFEYIEAASLVESGDFICGVCGNKMNDKTFIREEQVEELG